MRCLEAFFQRRPDEPEFGLGGEGAFGGVEQHAAAFEMQAAFGHPLQGLHVDAVLEDVDAVEQLFVVLILPYGQYGLHDDRATVHDGIDHMHGATAELSAVFPRITSTVSPREGGEV